MEYMDYAGYIMAAVIIAIILWITFGSRKKQWYIVYLANNDVMLLQRDMKERWWRTSDRYMRFVDEQGNEWTFPSNAHWILMWKAIPNQELAVARNEVNRIKEARAKELESL